MPSRQKVSLPTVSSNIPPDLRAFVNRVREVLASGQFITQAEWTSLQASLRAAADAWVDSRVDDIIGGGGIGGGGDSIPDRPCGETVFPTAPTGLTVEGAFSTILLSWDPAPYCGHAYTEIWAAQNDNLGEATIVGTAPGPVFGHAVGEGQAYYYWIRFVNDKDEQGPYNATGGTYGESANSVAYIMSLLAGQITESELYQDLAARIDLIDAPVTGLVSRVDVVENSLGSQVTDLTQLRASISDLAGAADIIPDPTFDTWTGTYPANWYAWNTGPAKEEVEVLTGRYAPRWDVGATLAGLAHLESRYGYSKYFVVECTFKLVSGTLDGAGISFRWRDSSGTILSQSNVRFSNLVASPVLGQWYTVNTIIEADDSVEATFDDYHVFLMANWDVLGTPTAKDLIVDRLSIRMAEPSYAALQVESTVRAEQTGDLYGQYTVKIDLDGYVSGFGLASEAPVDGNPSSAFAVRADQFYIATPENGGQQIIPFIVRTTPVTIGGDTIQPGVYIDKGYIDYLEAGMVKAGTFNADRVNAFNITAYSRLSAAEIEVAGGRIFSTNYDAGNLGWEIDYQGNANLYNAIVRGTIMADNGYFLGTLRNVASTGFGTGIGLWSGVDGATYKFRLGDPQGARLEWDGSSVKVYDSSGNLTMTSGELDWSAIIGAPSSLADINAAEHQQLIDTTATAATALQDAANAQAVADGKITAFYQDNAPTGFIAPGDLWFDTNDGNKVYIYDNGSWVVAQDTAIADAIDAAQTAQTTADGKAVIYYQESPPTGASEGDLWFDSNDGNKPYRYSGSAWVVVQDAAISTALAAAANAQSTADGKIRAFYQATAPSGADEGDLWFDTDDGNKVYRYTSGAWAVAQDTAIADAIDAAQTAQTTADGKAEVFYQSSAPAGASEGDLWYDTNDPQQRVYRRTSGEWQVIATNGATIGVDLFGQIDSGNISTYIAGGAITNAYIGNVIQSGNYVPNVAGWVINKDGTAEFHDIYARGDVEATSLKADALEIVDTANIKDLAVETLKLGENAVTVPTLSFQGGQVFFSSGGTPAAGTTLAELTVVKETSEPLYLHFYGVLDQVGSTAVPYIWAYVNDVLTQTITLAPSAEGLVNIVMVNTGAANTYTYRFDGGQGSIPPGANGGVRMVNRTIFAMETKR